MMSLTRGRWLRFVILCNVASSFVINPSHHVVQKPIPLHFRNKSELYIQITNKNLDEQFAAWDAEPDPEPSLQQQEQQRKKEESSVLGDAPIESFGAVEQSTNGFANTYKEPSTAQIETSWAGTGDSATTRFNQRVDSSSTKKIPIRNEPATSESIVTEVPDVEEVIVDMEKENASSGVIIEQANDGDVSDQTIDMIQMTDMDPPDVEEVIVDMVKEKTSSDVIIEQARSNVTQDVSDETIDEIQSKEIDPTITQISKETEVQRVGFYGESNVTETSDVYETQQDLSTETLEKEVPMKAQESTKDKTFDEDIADEETIPVASNEVVTQDFVIEKLDQEEIQNEADILEVDEVLDEVTLTYDGDSDSFKEDDNNSQVPTNNTDSIVEARTKAKSVEILEEETIPFFANFGKVGKKVSTSSPKSTSKISMPFFIGEEIVPQKKNEIQDQNVKITDSIDEVTEAKNNTNINAERNEIISKPKTFVTKPKQNKRKWSQKKAVPDEIDYLSPEEAADSVSSYLDMIEAQAMEKVKLLEEQNNADIEGLEAASSFLDSLKSLVTPDLKSLFKRDMEEFPLKQQSVDMESLGQESLPLEKPQVDMIQEITALEERLEITDQSAFSKQTLDSNKEEIKDHVAKYEGNIVGEEPPSLEGTSLDLNMTEEKIDITDESNFPKLEEDSVLEEEEVEYKIVKDEADTLSEVVPSLEEKNINGIHEGEAKNQVDITPSIESYTALEVDMTPGVENLDIVEESYIISKQDIDSKLDGRKDEFLEDDSNTVDDTLARTVDVDLLDSPEDDNNIIFLEDNEDVKNETLENRIQFDQSEESSEDAGNSNLLKKGGDAEEPTNCTSVNEELVHEEIEYTYTKFLTTEKEKISSESDERNSGEELQSPPERTKKGDELELTSESIENLSASKLDKAISSLTPEDIANLSPEEAEIAVKQFIAQAEEEMMKELQLLEEEKDNEIEALQSEALHIEKSFFPSSEEELALMSEEELEDLKQRLTNAEIDSSNQKSTESIVDENVEELKVNEANLDEALRSLGDDKVFKMPEEIAKLPAEEASRKVNEFVAMIEDDTKSKLESMEKEYNAQIEELTLQLINVEKREDIDQDSNEIMEQINAYEEMIAQLVDEEGLDISIQDIIEGKAEEKLQHSIQARAELSDKSNNEENDVESLTNTDKLGHSSISYDGDDSINDLLSDYMKKNQEETSKALFELEKMKNEEIATLKKQIELASIVGDSMVTQKYVEDLKIQIESFQDYMSKYLVHLHEEKLKAVREAEEYIEKKYHDQLNAFLLGESFEESYDN